MKIFALFPAIELLWQMGKLAKKAWRLFVVLLFAALVAGCTSASSEFEKSPCACNFKPLSTDNFGGRKDA